jgi:hypothetical protein
MSDRSGARSREGQVVRRAGVVASVALVLVAIALALAGGSGGAKAVGGERAAAFVSPEEVADVDAELGHPVYWAGRRGPAHLELRVESEGSVYLRYLPPGVASGDPRQDFLSVATYPVDDAVGALRRAAAGAGTKVRRVNRGVLFVDPAAPRSAYLAYPRQDFQVEVYDPEPGMARTLIESGQVRPVG